MAIQLPDPPALPQVRSAPLSYAQLSFWFLDQLEPGSTAYTIAVALRLDGPLDVEILRRTFTEIVRRHSALRTSFEAQPDDPRQIVREPAPFDLPVVDLEAGGDPAAAVRREAARLQHAPFDLQRDCLLRARLVRQSDRRHVLLMTLHHIAGDAWSRQVLLDELAAIYGAFADGRESPLPPLPMQFADYVAWQRESLEGDELARQLAYWHATLQGLSPLELPADRQRPARLSPAAERCDVDLPADLVASVRALCHVEGASVFVAFLAVFQVLVARLTGRTDVAVGIPIANRRRPEVEPLIGLFINTLVIRNDLSHDPTFRQLLGRSGRTALAAIAHQDLPFDQLVADLQPVRDLSRMPLVQVLFNKSDVRGTDVTIGPLHGVREDCFESQAQFDLTIYVWPDGPAPYLRAVYARDLFDHGRVAEWLEQLVGLVRAVARDPDRPISQYSLVTERGRHVVPDPAAPLPAPADRPSVIRQFEAQAGQYPDREAVRWRGTATSYAALAAAVRQCADLLYRRGLAPGDVVAIRGEPSVGLVAGLLGAMAAGGVALPIDRRMPAARVRTMAARSGVRWTIVAGTGAIDADGADAGGSLVRLDPASGRPLDATAAAVGDGAAASRADLDSEQSAYIFFTSGSTGEPKGILGHHRGLAHFVDWQRTAFGIGPGDRVAQVASWSFDVLLREIFLPLTSGATMCLPEADDVTVSPAALAWMPASGLRSRTSCRQSRACGSTPPATNAWRRCDGSSSRASRCPAASWRDGAIGRRPRRSSICTARPKRAWPSAPARCRPNRAPASSRSVRRCRARRRSCSVRRVWSAGSASRARSSSARRTAPGATCRRRVRRIAIRSG